MSREPTTYFTIREKSEGVYIDKGSKFIGLAYPVSSEEEVKEILKRVKGEYKGARHLCYAFVMGKTKELSRANDDGEPSGTAGKPILGQLTSFNVTNTLVIVVRYFGGVLLGTGGLIQAYKNAAKEALQNATVIEKEISETLQLECEYAVVPAVISLLKRKNISFHYDQSSPDKAFLRAEIPARIVKEIKSELEKLV